MRLAALRHYAVGGVEGLSRDSSIGEMRARNGSEKPIVGDLIVSSRLDYDLVDDTLEEHHAAALVTTNLLERTVRSVL